MIYDSLDVIPAKIFFRIVETGNLRLLTDDESIPEDELMKIWQRLEEEDAEINPNKEVEKTIDIWKYIEFNLAKLKAIESALFCLRKKVDIELIEMLKDFGYKFTGNLQKDLDRVERESQAIMLKVEKLQGQLPEPTKGKNPPFDEVVLSYGAIAEMGFIDTNKITKNQYDALIAIGNKKIKSLEKNGRKGR